METFRGKAHLPGSDEEWNIELEIDWDKKWYHYWGQVNLA